MEQGHFKLEQKLRLQVILDALEVMSLMLGSNEVVTLSVIDTFDPGINQDALLFPLNTTSDSVTQISGR